jgi:hypothetical protein
MALKMQTDGFVVIGMLPNEEHYPCLICGEIPDFVYVDLFTPEPKEIPAAIASRVANTLAMKYRLCLRCHEAKPLPSKLRQLALERLKALGEDE